jgi:hypothetical protein
MDTCDCCGTSLVDGRCLNIDCSQAREYATAGAARDTRKVSAGMAALAEPRAFTSSGRVD